MLVIAGLLIRCESRAWYPLVILPICVYCSSAPPFTAAPSALLVVPTSACCASGTAVLEAKDCAAEPGCHALGELWKPGRCGCCPLPVQPLLGARRASTASDVALVAEDTLETERAAADKPLPRRRRCACRPLMAARLMSQSCNANSPSVCTGVSVQVFLELKRMCTTGGTVRIGLKVAWTDVHWKTGLSGCCTCSLQAFTAASSTTHL